MLYVAYADRGNSSSGEACPSRTGKGTKTLPFHDRSPEETEELVHRQRTELDSQNQRLQQYRDRYVDFYDSLPVGYATLDAGGNILEVNLAGARLLNADRDSLKGYPFVDCVAKEDQKAFLDHVRECVQEHRELSAELALVAHDGHSVIVQLRSVPGDGPEGQEDTCCRTAIIDITERRQMEDTIRRSQAFLQTVIDSIPDPMLVIDREHRTVLANRAARIMAGETDPVSRCLTCYWLAHQRDLPCAGEGLQCPLKQVVEKKAPATVTHTRYDSNGEERFIEVVAAPIVDETGEVLHIIETRRDITERQRVKESLQRAKAAAEEANEVKGRFLANISHELRTPMNAILGLVDLALPKQVDPTATDFLKTATESAHLLLSLLNDLLDFSKIEAGRLELESAPFSLRRTLGHLTRVLSVRASEKGLIFSCRMPAEVPDALIGDPVRLRQVLSNLADNAIKFTERGKVEVGVRVQSQDTEEACLEFTVWDTGIGILQSDLERIFHPFSQADASTTRRFGGTGLGLSICSSLVGMMGGHIWVESEAGKGSTFHFNVRLPLAAELPPEPETPDVPAAALSKLRILLVEDNAANQKLATYILQNRGHLVEIAGDGQEAICLIEQNRYDVILMDVQMPEMDGLEATAAIRAREVGKRRTPIIAMTAYAMKGDRERCLAVGMDGYLSKPIDAHETIALVESLAGGATAAGAGAASTRSCPTEPVSSPATTVFEPVIALKRCFNKQDLLREMIAYFFKDADNLRPQMRAALQKGDLTEVGRLGHRMKGTLVHLGAVAASEAVQRVERFMLYAGEQAEAEDAVSAFERECEVLRAVLTEYRATTSPMQGGQ